jgi:hypothetical protein
VATPLIAYPFRLSPAGNVTTVEEGSDTQLAHELACAVLTRPGERPLVPDFGTADPVFEGFDEDALRLHVDLFGPPVEVERVRMRFLDELTQDVVVQFSASGR